MDKLQFSVLRRGEQYIMTLEYTDNCDNEQNEHNAKSQKETNIVEIAGFMDSEKVLSHEVYGEKFYTFNLSVKRLSEQRDIIPVLYSERLILEPELLVPDANITVSGQFRSYNNPAVTGSNRLMLTVFAKDIQVSSDNEKFRDLNTVFIDGYICKPPIYRTTPFGREIADILLAVNRAYNKSDYIPCIAWGRNARYCDKLKVGTNIRIWGRIQSRLYQKKVSENEVVSRTAYEISIARLELPDGR